MNMDKNSARNTLFQIVFLLVSIAVLLFVFKHQLITLYTSGDMSMTGLMLNGFILALFLLGMLRMVITLLRYVNEHQALRRLVRYLQEDAADPIARLAPNALSVQRYKYVHWINRQGAPVNQAALAATLNASESSRLTLIRFVHSILILAGVFGTVVSLSLALVGASSLLGSPESSNEMGVVIGGMSSALSTTMTAIICFIIYVYFYLRLNDSRVQLLSGIEDATTLYMLPKISHSEASLIRHVERLATTLNKSAKHIADVEKKFVIAADQLQQASVELKKGVNKTGMKEVLTVLREGFRLPKTEEGERLSAP
ncbi:MAG: MotA/TolQ/ExbB proton channel family protein, partial [Cocleimonas sp.]|nr:MotA/TolQ/ExbB proton channel family protein [Cocleimonas sp.]